VLEVLGVPFAAALSVMVAAFDLIPLVGATLAAILVGLVTIFSDFPTATIIWAAYAFPYHQFEVYVIHPQIQRRAVDLEPFVVLVAVLFGATVYGIVGALLAIPVAATIQIAMQEWWRYRRDGQLEIGTADGLPAAPPRGESGGGTSSPAPA
jgi:predicted PurR-regulated permease PerM